MRVATKVLISIHIRAPFLFANGYGDSMSRVMRNPVLGVSDQVRHKPGCTTTEEGLAFRFKDGEILYTVLSM